MTTGAFPRLLRLLELLGDLVTPGRRACRRARRDATTAAAEYAAAVELEELTVRRAARRRG